MTIGERLLIGFVFLVTPLIFIGVPFYLLSGGSEKFALKPLMRCFEGLDIAESPRTGDVTFTYHTYRGLLVWYTQDEFVVSAPLGDAKTLLGRLLRYNLTWGMLSNGLVFVPFLALGNYFVQRAAIHRQGRSGSQT